MQKLKFACHLIIVSFLISILSSVTMVQAASKTQMALKAYSKYLSKSQVDIMKSGAGYWDLGPEHRHYKTSNSSNVQFALAYINNDTIPELILKEVIAGYYSTTSFFGVFTYAGGKVVRLQAGGGYDSFSGYYRRKGLFVITRATEGTPYYKDYYRVNGSVTKKILTLSDFDGMKEYSYLGKEISKAKFNSYLKNIVGYTKMTKCIFRKNTMANRKKYF